MREGLVPCGAAGQRAARGRHAVASVSDRRAAAARRGASSCSTGPPTQRAWLIEDDYDGEFRYDGRPLAALKSLDRDGRVIYIGSFSKALFPALRLGYMVLPPALRDAFVAAKWLEDRGCNALEQAALARFMADGGFERHLRRAAQTLRARRTAMLTGLARHAAGVVEVVDSNAGMHLTAWLVDVQPRRLRAPDRARARRAGSASMRSRRIA